MKEKKVSKLLLKRLTLYLNYLKSLPEDTTNISATTIAKDLELGDVLVRKDLARVSGGGRCKTGHVRDRLIQDIEQFLAFGDTTNAVVIGAGMLGKALLEYPGFEAVGIRLVAGFDIRAEAGYPEKGRPIYPVDRLESFCADNHIRIGILTVPDETAQAVCDCLVSCGIRAVWNFTPVQLNVPDHIVVQNENLAISLASLRMQLNQ